MLIMQSGVAFIYQAKEKTTERSLSKARLPLRFWIFSALILPDRMLGCCYLDWEAQLTSNLRGSLCGCGTKERGLGMGLGRLGWWLDLGISKVFHSLSDSVTVSCYLSVVLVVQLTPVHADPPGAVTCTS